MSGERSTRQAEEKGVQALTELEARLLGEIQGKVALLVRLSAERRTFVLYLTNHLLHQVLNDWYE